MGFFTIVAWIWVVIYTLALAGIYLEYRQYKKMGSERFFMANLELETPALFAFILAVSWLGWRYFGG